MARKTVTPSAIVTFLAQTVGSLTVEDVRNLMDAINKKSTTPSQTLTSVLT